MYGLKLITPATHLPITLEEATEHVRADDDDDQALIEAMLRAAISHAERWMARCLVQQTWDLTLDGFPACNKPIRLPRSPLIAVDGVFYFVDDETEEEFEDCIVDTGQEPGRVFLTSGASWPDTRQAPASVRVRFRAGYVQPGSPIIGEVPPDILAAVKLILGTFYNNREDAAVGVNVMPLPRSAEDLMRQHRVAISLA